MPESGEIRVEVERVIGRSATDVLALLRDYRQTRPRILSEHFQDYAVQSGGEGSGTVVGYVLRAGRRERRYRMAVDEPDPGRVLRERDEHSTLVVTWTTISESGGERATVNVVVSWEGASGVGGFFERRFAPAAVRSIYERVLANLGAVAERR